MIKYLLCMVLFLLLTTGCQNKISPDQIPEVQTEAVELVLPIEDNKATDTYKHIEHRGEGRFSSDNKLVEEQKNLILSFMDDYYDSLSLLKLIDPSSYFIDSKSSNAVLNKVSWSFMIEIRKKQTIDLLLNQYEYELTVESIEIEEGDIKIRLREDSSLNFRAYPNTESEQYDVRHNFTLQNTSDGWKIKRHYQSGTLFRTLMGDYHNNTSDDEAKVIDDKIVIAGIYSKLDDLLEMSDYNMLQRDKPMEDYRPLEYDHMYNREAAIEYANAWIGKRNDIWLDYSSYGGNCQNFASQVLLAGGIPMDIEGNEIWKWYGSTLSNKPTSKGRTSSWTGVDEFFAYVNGNKGFGLVADGNVPYDSGDVGDIIILGYNQDWRHTVVISEVVKDESGSTIDYLVHSNTYDLRNFPVSAYNYTMQKIIKIYGWNE